MKRILVLSLLILLKNVSAQDLGSNLSQVGSQYAQSYLQPFIDTYGAAINSGFFNSVKIPENNDSKLTVTISIKTIGSFVPANQKTFSSVYNTTVVLDTLGQSQTVAAVATVKNAPTFFGSSKPGVATIDINDTISVAGIIGYPVHRTYVQQTFGGLLNSNIAPLLVPQLDLGTVLGTQMFVRWIPPVKVSGYGTTNYFGIGIRHNLSQYIPSMPLNIAGAFSYQNFSANDTTGTQVTSLSAESFSLEVSKSFYLFEWYGALQYETSTLSVNYNYIPPSNSNQSQNYRVNINFNLTGKNSFRFLTGVSLYLGGFFLNADVNVSNINTVTFGIGYNIL
jgi:hypothetical protein